MWYERERDASLCSARLNDFITDQIKDVSCKWFAYWCWTETSFEDRLLIVYDLSEITLRHQILYWRHDWWKEKVWKAKSWPVTAGRWDSGCSY